MQMNFAWIRLEFDRYEFTVNIYLGISRNENEVIRDIWVLFDGGGGNVISR